MDVLHKVCYNKKTNQAIVFLKKKELQLKGKRLKAIIIKKKSLKF